MAINKTLVEFFGDGAVQTLADVTLVKASLRSRRTPVAFHALIAADNNSAESLFLAFLLMAWENQDTSQDSELVIGGPNIELVEIVKDGVVAIADRYVFPVIITAPRPPTNTLPNPNNV